MSSADDVLLTEIVEPHIALLTLNRPQARNEVRWGLIAGGGGVIRLPRAIPRRIAFEMIATAKPISAADAGHYGLVNAVVPAGQVTGTALGLARRICANAPLAVRESLALARRPRARRRASYGP